ncbi:hypothetical protein, partial [Zavarzinella formosa]|uniref:hypothetical protein n=1 Tax=Zavarzinella formosa TaxID=360055 RepID=UPI00138B08EE
QQKAQLQNAQARVPRFPLVQRFPDGLRHASSWLGVKTRLLASGRSFPGIPIELFGDLIVEPLVGQNRWLIVHPESMSFFAGLSKIRGFVEQLDHSIIGTLTNHSINGLLTCLGFAERLVKPSVPSNQFRFSFNPLHHPNGNFVRLFGDPQHMSQKRFQRIVPSGLGLDALKLGLFFQLIRKGKCLLPTIFLEPLDNRTTKDYQIP